MSLLWSFKNDAHERRIAEIIEEEAPERAGHAAQRAAPAPGRIPAARHHGAERLAAARLRRAVQPGDPARRARSHRGAAADAIPRRARAGRDIDREAASTVMSGPVGGVVACRISASRHPNIVATDMGGTSFEVGLILDGAAHIANTTWIGRHEIALPSVSVRTVGAGSARIAARGQRAVARRARERGRGARAGLLRARRRPPDGRRRGPRARLSQPRQLPRRAAGSWTSSARRRGDRDARRRAARASRSRRRPRGSRRSSTRAWPT